MRNGVMVGAAQLFIVVCGMAQGAHLSETLARKERNKMGSHDLHTTALLSYSTKVILKWRTGDRVRDDTQTRLRPDYL